MTMFSHVGTDFDDFLRAEGLLADAEALAIKRVVAYRLGVMMEKQGISKAELARRMRTSRSSLDRLLDPENASVTLQTLERAAQALGKRFWGWSSRHEEILALAWRCRASSGVRSKRKLAKSRQVLLKRFRLRLLIADELNIGCSRMISRLLPSAVALIAFTLLPAIASGETMTFVDRWDAIDLRVVTYNIYRDRIFSSSTEMFSRIVNALQPDVLNVQEVYNHSAADVSSLMDELAPLPGGARWFAHKASDNVIVSKFPFLLTTSVLGEPGALIDLPDAAYERDLFVINNHWPCCDNEASRQSLADQTVGAFHDLRTPGGQIDIPNRTPILFLGDLNIVRSNRPLETVLTGDAADPLRLDSPPDWDGTSLADPRPLHNGIGPESYTWRNDFEAFDPGVLDFILYTDSVLQVANSFVLNTTTMSASDLAAIGLEPLDVVLSTTSNGFNFDHLPVVVDFRFSTPDAGVSLGDYNGDGMVDAADYPVWRDNLGDADETGLMSNGDGGGVTQSDYDNWKSNFGNSYTAIDAPATSVPEPASLALACGGLILAAALRRRSA